jgi:hypothetical protein
MVAHNAASDVVIRWVRVATCPRTRPARRRAALQRVAEEPRRRLVAPCLGTIIGAGCPHQPNGPVHSQPGLRAATPWPARMNAAGQIGSTDAPWPSAPAHGGVVELDKGHVRDIDRAAPVTLPRSLPKDGPRRQTSAVPGATVADGTAASAAPDESTGSASFEGRASAHRSRCEVAASPACPRHRIPWPRLGLPPLRGADGGIRERGQRSGAKRRRGSTDPSTACRRMRRQQAATRCHAIQPILEHPAPRRRRAFRSATRRPAGATHVSAVHH